MTDHSAGHDAAQRSALGGAWNANPFAAPQPGAGGDNTLLNRPANQAQLASPTAAAQNARDWQAQNGATDFLGLDAELGLGAQAPRTFTPAPATVGAPVRPSEVPDESWLMGMGEERVSRAAPMEDPADVELAPAEPLLNAVWQEPVSGPRRNKLMLPLVACAAGFAALSGVVWMQSHGGIAGDGEPVLISERASSSSAVAATAAPETEPSAPRYASRELTPVAPLEGEMTPPPEVELTQATPRETSDTRVSVGSSEPGGLESMVEVVPALATVMPAAPQAPPESAWASDPNDPVYSQAPIDSGTEADTSTDVRAEQEHDLNTLPELDAQQPQASSSAPMPAPASAPSALQLLAPDISTNVASGTLAEPVPASSELDVMPPVSAPELALDAQANASPLVAALALMREPQELDQSLESLPMLATPSASPPSTFIGPTFAGVASSPTAQELVYGPTPSDIAAESVGDTSGPVGFVERTSVLELEQVLLLDEGASNMRRANVQDLKGMWTESTVPFEAIGAASKVLTPAVGKVRVVLTAGEIFEGDLYAVGEGCIWLNTQYGRMGLAGARVKSVAQIDSPKGAPALGAPGSEELAGMERARIKTPGGVIYGKVIERDALRTTVMTEDGARLTLDSKDVELLSQTPTVSIKK